VCRLYSVTGSWEWDMCIIFCIVLHYTFPVQLIHIFSMGNSCKPVKNKRLFCVVGTVPQHKKWVCNFVHCSSVTEFCHNLSNFLSLICSVDFKQDLLFVVFYFVGRIDSYSTMFGWCFDIIVGNLYRSDSTVPTVCAVVMWLVVWGNT